METTPHLEILTQNAFRLFHWLLYNPVVRDQTSALMKSRWSDLEEN